ncbi:MAG: hypothetical protein ACKOEZ_09225, partial [Spartobacteria bacterium]
TTDPGVRRRLDLETAAAKRRVEVVGAGTQVALEPLPTMPDSRIPAENGAAQDSSLVKPPPVLPKIPAEIPNLPYPDL